MITFNFLYISEINCCSSPKISLKNGQGISNTVVSELQKQLEEKAENMKGEEMIFQLAQHVQEFLHRHNKPGTKSFYEEMLNRKKEEEQKIKMAREIEQNREVSFVVYIFFFIITLINVLIFKKTDTI